MNILLIFTTTLTMSQTFKLTSRLAKAAAATQRSMASKSMDSGTLLYTFQMVIILFLFSIFYSYQTVFVIKQLYCEILSHDFVHIIPDITKFARLLKIPTSS